MYNAVRGVDYDAMEPLSVTFSAGSVLEDGVAVAISIPDDLSVDGLKNFTAEVIGSALVIPGTVATIFIRDIDSKYYTIHILSPSAHIAVYIELLSCNICF